MPPTTAIFLRLTDGVTTLDLVDGTNYALILDGWAPQVAPRRTSTLGGLVYEDVEEEITINVMGTTAAIALTNLAALTTMLDQAARRYAGEHVNPVTVQYQPQGSTLADPLRAMILDRGTVESPATFNDTAGILYELDHVRIRFRRRGQWLLPFETAAGAAGTYTMPFIGWRTFGTAHAPSSPLVVRLGGFTATSTPTIPRGYLLVSKTDDRLWLPASDTATATGFTTVADVAANASGGNVLRYTPTTTNPASSGVMAIGADISSEARTIGVLATVRNNSGAAEWSLSATLYGKGVSVATEEIDIEIASGTDPQVVYLGSVTSERANFQTLTMNVTASTTTGPPTLDIDVVYLIALDDEYSRILAIDEMTLTGAFASGATVVELTVSDRSDTNRVPFVGAFAPSTGEAVYASYRGDPLLAITGDTAYIAWLACGGGNDASWVATNGAGAVLAGMAVNAGRHKAYLSPQ